MSWYRAGSVTVAAGSNVVTGAGTDFVANTSVGEAFIGPDGRSYEIGQIVSATELRLTTVYGSSQAYAIQPTQSFARDLALAAAALLNTFSAVRDGVGQGMFSDGSAAAPGMRFMADQDTGLRRYAENALAMVGGGVDRIVMDGSGRVGIGGAPGYFFDVLSPSGPYVARMINTNGGSDQYAVVLFGQAEGGAATGYVGTGGSQVPNLAFRGNFVVGTQNAKPLVFATSDNEKARIDASGNFLVGVSSSPGGFGGRHRISSPAGAAGTNILSVDNNGAISTLFLAVTGANFNTSACAQYVGKSDTTNRSINAGGTVNASGADYAEYMIKAAGCGIIAKGDVCGVDRDGKLTKTWADAISFVVKSTDPSLVGGDTWAAHLPPRPDAPGAEPQPPVLPALPTEGATDAEVAAYRDSLAAYPALVAQHRVDHDAWAAATAAYARDFPAWEADLEAARQCVDRIAFCGQVPCNVSGDFEVGDYIVAAASGAGIKAVAMKAGTITLAQYMARIGKVWAIRDGRAWIDVQHG